MFVLVDLVSSIQFGTLYAVSQDCLLTGVPDFTTDPCGFAWIQDENVISKVGKDIHSKFPSLVLVGLDHEIINNILEV